MSVNLSPERLESLLWEIDDLKSSLEELQQNQDRNFALKFALSDVIQQLIALGGILNAEKKIYEWDS